MTKALGFVSTAHIHFKGFADDIARNQASARIGAIWDGDQDRGRRNADRYGVPFIDDLSRFVARDDLDGFILCAPNVDRLSLMRVLAPVGKPILCEKPLALTADEALTIRALIHQHDLTVTTGYFRQGYGAYRAAESVIANGMLGTVTHARFRNTHDGAYRRIFDDPDVAWMADPTLAGGGGALDMGSHALHLLAWLFGPAEAVWASITNRSAIYPDVDDHGVFQVRFRTGVEATAEGGWVDVDEPGELAIYGNTGSFHATDRSESAEAYVFGTDRQRRRIDIPSSGPQRVSRLIAAMNGDIPEDELARELDAAARATAMAEAAYRSAETGTWQPVADI